MFKESLINALLSKEILQTLCIGGCLIIPAVTLKFLDKYKLDENIIKKIITFIQYLIILSVVCGMTFVLTKEFINIMNQLVEVFQIF